MDIILCIDVYVSCLPMGFPTLATAFVVSGAAVVCAVKGTTCVAKGPVDTKARSKHKQLKGPLMPAILLYESAYNI